MKRIIAALCLVVAFPATAQIYKCTVDGRAAFQDHPCGAKSRVMGTQQSVPQAANVAKAKQSQAEETEQVNNAIRRRVINRQIDQLERDIETTQSRKDRALAALQEKKSLARNNLAGATWEQSISGEMQAVATNYEGEISRTQNEINRLRAERDGLK